MAPRPTIRQADGDVGPARDRLSLRPRIPAPPAIRPADGKPLTARGRELLDVMEALFLAQGFHHLTVADLTAHLSCSRRTLYELAPTKDELVSLVLDRMLRRMGRRAAEATEQASPRLRQLVVFMDSGVVELRSATLRFSRDVRATPAVQRLFDAHFTYAVAVLEEIVRLGVAEDEFQPIDPRLVAEVLVGGIDRLQDPDVLEATGLTIGDVVAQLTTLVSCGLLAPANGRSSAAGH